MGPWFSQNRVKRVADALKSNHLAMKFAQNSLLLKKKTFENVRSMLELEILLKYYHMLHT